MAYAPRTDRFGGGSRGGFKGPSKFGGASKGRGFTDRGSSFEKPTLYSATCADCGERCEVPFRPNGKKPVLCRSCFGQNNDAEPKFSPRDSGRSAGNDETVALLRSISSKLDVIIKSMKGNDLSL